MTAPRRGKKPQPTSRAGGTPSDTEPDGEAAAGVDARGLVPDLLRRMLGVGFATEEVLRKALGDAVPRDWLEFAASQGERTRRELADRLAAELGRSLRTADLEQFAERLLRSYTVEVTARLRLVPRDDAEDGNAETIRLRIAREEEP